MKKRNLINQRNRMNGKVTQNKSTSELIVQCRDQMRELGCCPDSLVLGSKSFVRFNPNGGRKKPCFYKADTWTDHLGREHLSCLYGSWEGGLETHTFKETIDISTLTEQDKKRIEKEKLEWKKKMSDLLNLEVYEKKKEANIQWGKADTHPRESYFDDVYFTNKKVDRFGLRYCFDKHEKYAAIMPLRNTDGNITGLQYIYPTGKKITRGLKKGSFHLLGEIAEGEILYLVEGYATGATIHKSSQEAVCIAVDCHNLIEVAKRLKAKFPNVIFIIAGDDDVYDKEGKSRTDNPGKECATEAAIACGGETIFPFFDEPRGGTDFNDLYVERGEGALKNQLKIPDSAILGISLADFLDMEIKAPEYLINPWMRERNLCMLYAAKGVGKTFIGLTIAYALSIGSDLFNGKWKVPKTRRVLYVDGEMSAASIHARMKKIVKMFEPAYTEPDLSNFILINMELQKESLGCITGAKAQRSLLKNISSFGIDLVILDNISVLMTTGDENEAKSWAPIQKFLLKLKTMGVCVLFISHSGKNELVQRGTSKKEDVVDTTIQLAHRIDYNPTQGASFDVTFTKSREFEGIDAMPFSLNLEKNTDGDIYWNVGKVYVKKEDEKKSSALKNMEDEILRLHEKGFSLRGIIKRIKKDHGVGISYGALWRFLDKFHHEKEGEAGLDFLENEPNLNKK